MQKATLNGYWLRSQLASSKFHKWLLLTRRKGKVQFAKHVHGIVNREWRQTVADGCGPVSRQKPPERPGPGPWWQRQGSGIASP